MANNPAKSTPTKKQGVGLYDGSLKRVAPSTALNHAQSGILIGLDLLFISERISSYGHENQAMAMDDKLFAAPKLRLEPNSGDIDHHIDGK
ncbi:hypothetical protein F2Q68_00011217 [Brassica cretica]|uniref:Uncharacterized protein n=1 Tax=Brassica cretica TaxID=69181 RepID=A0A8S9KW56_BRACR|nr:hypothetical protein F2Q68_00011217 [Brassica cretica]